MKLRYAIAALTLSLNFNPVHADETDAFRVCADPLHPPYSTQKQEGFENKIAALFAEKLGLPLEYYWFPQRIGFIRNTLKAEIEGTDRFKCDIVMGIPVGFELAKTTQAYYHSTYVLLIAQGRGWDDIKQPNQLANLSLDREEALKIAMFDRGPGTAWLQQNGLLAQGIPYQSMSGDNENNVAMQIQKDLEAGIIDMVILWGPMAGYIASQSPQGAYRVIPMQSTPSIQFDFSIAMGVRYGDNARKAQLDQLIDTQREHIAQILTTYQVPLLPIPEPKKRDDDD